MGSIEIIEHEKILALPEHLNYDPIKEPQTRNGRTLYSISSGS